SLSSCGAGALARPSRVQARQMRADATSLESLFSALSAPRRLRFQHAERNRNQISNSKSARTQSGPEASGLQTAHPFHTRNEFTLRPARPEAAEAGRVAASAEVSRDLGVDAQGERQGRSP